MSATDDLPRLRDALRRRAAAATTRPIAACFTREPERLARLTVAAAGLHLDLSKQCLDLTTLDELLALAEAAGVAAAREAMFAGAVINRSEGRAVLHTALRAGPACPATVDGEAVAGAVEAVLARMATLAAAVRGGRWVGSTGATITDVVNIGIGGSHLGPQLVCDALRGHADGPHIHFLANVDGGEFARVVRPLDPARTLFIVASKSFTTSETRLNALSARSWLTDSLGATAAVDRHFVAVSASPARAVEFGMAAENVYPLWDWVGGRYSLWSAIGLPIALAIGMDGFRALLAGARAMDEHFRDAPAAANMPLLMALVGLWNCDFLGADSYAVVPYDDRLRDLPAYLQQLEMESNGKRVTVHGSAVDGATAPVTWGGLGTNAQHAFFQLLHQGTRRVPVDFVLCLRHPAGLPEHHDVLVANCLAQAEALMIGRPDGGGEPAREVPGNRPNSLLTLEALEPATLGALIALYEHKTFVQSVVWDINAFDQWGVELGKQLAQAIEGEIAARTVGAGHDPSTAAQLARYLAARG